MEAYLFIAVDNFSQEPKIVDEDGFSSAFLNSGKADAAIEKYLNSHIQLGWEVAELPEYVYGWLLHKDSRQIKIFKKTVDLFS